MGRSGQFPCKTNHKWDNIVSLKCRWCLTRKEDEQHILRKCRKCPISNRPINVEFFGQRSMADWHDLSNLNMEYVNILAKRNERRWSIQYRIEFKDYRTEHTEKYRTEQNIIFSHLFLSSPSFSFSRSHFLHSFSLFKYQRRLYRL